MKRVLFIATLMTTLAAPAAAASTNVVDARSNPRTGFKALISRSAIPTPQVTLVVTRDTSRCGQASLAVSGCAFRDRPEIVVKRSMRGRAARDVFMHEVGHVFDRMYLRHRDRQRFRRLLGIRGTWSPLTYAHEEAWRGAGEEAFAEAYRVCSYPRAFQRRRTEFMRGGVWITTRWHSWRWRRFLRACRRIEIVHGRGRNKNPETSAGVPGAWRIG